MQVPMLDLKAQHSNIRREVLGAVTDVLDSQHFIGGPKVKQLEEEVAALCGCTYAVGVSSGTDAILNSLMSLGIGPGDEVITTPFTFFATAGCITRVCAKPVFVDIDPETYNINPGLIEKAISKKTRAVMPVHLFGQMADMDPIMAVADRHNLAVIEDAAQSIGATYKGKKCGSIGVAGCISFYPSKNLGGAGDGGMVVTNDKNLAERLRLMRNHGGDAPYHHKYVGGNFRLDALQAAVLLVKLRYLEGWHEARRRHADYYSKKFAGSVVQAPYVRPDCVSVFYLYVTRVPRRDELAQHLTEKGIDCRIYYPVPLHLQECFRHLGYKEGDLPEAEKAAREVLAIPLYPELTSEMREYVAETILSFFSS
jgi:dTDP-4-amino-4,6-dideoxygalactose transaminase